MKNAITQAVKWFGSTGAVEQKFSTPFVLSMMAHVIFCLLFIGVPHFGHTNRKPASVINVQLVSATAPSQPSSPAPETRAPEPKAVASSAKNMEPAVAVKSRPKEAVSLAPKEETEKKRSLKNKTYKSERVLQSALKNIEKRVESSKPDQIQQALDRIQANLKAEEKNASTTDSGETGAAGTGGKGKPTSDAQLAYYAEIAVSIQKNWAFSEQLAGGKTDLFNEVVIKIMRNGEIKDVWFDRRSGNDYFDDSTYKAILKSSPLPPMPKEIAKASIELGIRFTPEGLK
jgi:colicin import membrane protein